MAIKALNALLLEDEPLISMDTEMILEAEGFDVSTVMSCVEANAWLDRHSPDVVIVDIELRDGACTHVVARLIRTNIPFVVYSGDHPSFYVGTPFAGGIWVGKPAASGELIHATKAAIEGRLGMPDLPANVDNKDSMTSPLA